MSEGQLRNGKRMDGIYTLTLALNTESVATFITTCFLKKTNKTSYIFRSSSYLNHKYRPRRLAPAIRTMRVMGGGDVATEGWEQIPATSLSLYLPVKIFR
jgi:hypothetical protein